jgi:hypothetical protein
MLTVEYDRLQLEVFSSAGEVRANKGRLGFLTC